MQGQVWRWAAETIKGKKNDDKEPEEPAKRRWGEDHDKMAGRRMRGYNLGKRGRWTTETQETDSSKVGDRAGNVTSQPAGAGRGKRHKTRRGGLASGHEQAKGRYWRISTAKRPFAGRGLFTIPEFTSPATASLARSSQVNSDLLHNDVFTFFKRGTAKEQKKKNTKTRQKRKPGKRGLVGNTMGKSVRRTWRIIGFFPLVGRKKKVSGGKSRGRRQHAWSKESSRPKVCSTLQRQRGGVFFFFFYYSLALRHLFFFFYYLWPLFTWR